MRHEHAWTIGSLICNEQLLVNRPVLVHRAAWSRWLWCRFLYSSLLVEVLLWWKLELTFQKHGLILLLHLLIKKSVHHTVSIVCHIFRCKEVVRGTWVGRAERFQQGRAWGIYNLILHILLTALRDSILRLKSPEAILLGPLLLGWRFSIFLHLLFLPKIQLLRPLDVLHSELVNN